MSASILGTGSKKGGKEWSSYDIDADLKLKAGTIEGLSGVKIRPIINSDETQESLAKDAVLLALEDAAVKADQLDLILFASAVGRQPIPSTAALIKRELGLLENAIPAMDINLTCLSVLAAMDIAALYIDAGRAKHVLIVASEIASRALPWKDDPGTAALFGDGAAALIMGAHSEGSAQLKLHKVALETWAAGYEFCQLPAGGTRFDFHTDRAAFEDNSHFQMDGHALFKLTRKKLPLFVDRLLEQSGWAHDDIDLVVPHQASPLALEHMIRRCGFEKEKIVSTVRETGNLVAASLPMTLDFARRTGRVQAGAKILMIGTSAGVSFGGATLSL